MENIRVTLHVPEQTSERMIELAGSERKKSAYIRDLIDTIYEKRHVPSSDDMDSIKYQLQGVYAELNSVKEQLKELRKYVGQTV